jgi:oligopeptide transport system permease protein
LKCCTLTLSAPRGQRAADAPHYFAPCAEAALLPVLSYMGPAFVGIITGSMVIETIYGLPGIGQLFVNGALNRDYSLVLSLTILVGALTILFNAIVDVLYAVIDPKIRY